MTDARLRELQRRFETTGTVADEAAWLAERVRAGELEAARLACAAHAGHAPAREALGDAAPPLPTGEEWSDLHPWAKGFREYDRALSIRVAVAAVEVAWRRWEPLFPRQAADTMRTWIATSSSWADCPCDAHQRAARSATRLVIGEDLPQGSAYMHDAAAGLARMAAGDPFWVGVIASARYGPGGERLTAEVLASIRAAGRAMLHEAS